MMVPLPDINQEQDRASSQFEQMLDVKAKAPAVVSTEVQTGLFIKMAKIMGEIETIPKTGYNKHHGYAYASDEDVLNCVRGLLAKHQVAFFAEMIEDHEETLSTKNGGKTTKTSVWFRYTFVCADTGQSQSAKWKGVAIDNQDKGLSKAATLAQKYFLLKTFNISTGNPEDDADNYSPLPEGKPQGKRPRQPKKAQAVPWYENPIAMKTWRETCDRAKASKDPLMPFDEALKQVGEFKQYKTLRDAVSRLSELMRGPKSAEAVPEPAKKTSVYGNTHWYTSDAWMAFVVEQGRKHNMTEKQLLDFFGKGSWKAYKTEAEARKAFEML